MKPPKDISGQRFGKLTAIEYLGRKNGRAIWKCKCDCGCETYKDHYSLIYGNVRSCGCLRKSKECKNFRHGLHKHRIYRIHSGIKQRCYNTNCPDYKNYGERGITVCEEWLGEGGFMNFYNWSMGNGYSDNLTIDRIDNDKPYSPQNCRWVDRKTQQNNTRFNKTVTYKGETHTLSEWSEILDNGISNTYMSHRISLGWNPIEAMITPVKSNRKKENQCPNTSN